MTSHYDYLLIGGFACVHAAQSIREQDKEGTILIIGEEPHPPYDRPPLSKDYLTDDEMSPDGPYSKYDDFYFFHYFSINRSITTCVCKMRLSNSIASKCFIFKVSHASYSMNNSSVFCS